ncbi:hypothetical protein ACH5RR_003102 [Cinchona calisaya]|uniref:Uncharacterized protein n=1 Tax=Cinchona calisaya TaxID=153742 RepID=A0ABD3ATX5_9GENT
MSIELSGSDLLGIFYGMAGDNLPSPSEVIAICKAHNVKKLRLVTPDEDVLSVPKGSNTEMAADKADASSLEVVVCGIGWPPEGSERGASYNNAVTFYSNLVNHVKLDCHLLDCVSFDCDYENIVWRFAPGSCMESGMLAEATSGGCFPCGGLG